MQNGEDKKLPDLPPSHYHFWDQAEKYSTEMQSPKKCEHSFEYKTGIEVYCKKCQIGFYLSGKEKVVNGHIWIGNELII